MSLVVGRLAGFQRGIGGAPKANGSGAFLSFTRAGVKERTLLRHSKGSARATVSLTVLGGADLTATVMLHAEAAGK